MYTLTYEEVQNHLGKTLDTVMTKPVTITSQGRQPVVMVPATEQILRAIRSFYFEQHRQKVRQSKREPITEEELQKITEEELQKIANESQG